MSETINYFDLYDLPLSWEVDASQLRKKYYALSRLYHPDLKHADLSEEEVLKKSAAVNEGYKILGNSDRLLGYVLKRLGAIEEGENYQLPAEFLMDMMDFNELVSEWEMDGDEKAASESVRVLNNHFKDLDEELAALKDRFEKNPSEAETLASIKDIYYRKKYLLRIKERINTFAAPE